MSLCSGSESQEPVRSAPSAPNPESNYAAAMDAAWRFLSFRPRSEAEVRRRLMRRFPPELVERLITALLGMNYVNDEEFALRWRKHRERFHPRGRRMLQRELVRFGVAREVVDQALEGLDEGQDAYRAVSKLAPKLISRGCSQEELQHRLYPYLQRRGFGYPVARDTVNRLWQELAPHPLDGKINADADTQETIETEKGIEPTAGQLQQNGQLYTSNHS